MYLMVLTVVRRLGADSTGWIGFSRQLASLATGDSCVMRKQ